MNSNLLKNEERAILALRGLYGQYGYLPFKMSKFEEYDLYVQNKSFLTSDSVITFNDTDGRLLALKPDVTLSIIKNSKDKPFSKRKVYYNENVYRVSQKTGRYKEIMQAGLECVGEIDLVDVFEVVYLGAKSLSLISEQFALDISHMGILSSVLDFASDNTDFKREFTRLISLKNAHEARALCRHYGLSEEAEGALMSLLSTYGKMDKVLKEICPIAKLCGAEDAYRELDELCKLLSKTSLKDKINIDFSVVNNLKYYNGIVFKGFLAGISESVLSGGEYATLMKRMGRGDSGIGFAIYLDLLEELSPEVRECDVDVLLIYSDSTDIDAVLKRKRELIGGGKSVLSNKVVPEKLRFREIIYMDK